MKEFKSSYEAYKYLSQINCDIKDALRFSNINRFEVLTNKLNEAALNKSKFGKNAILFNNLVGDQIYINDLNTQYAENRLQNTNNTILMNMINSNTHINKVALDSIDSLNNFFKIDSLNNIIDFENHIFDNISITEENKDFINELQKYIEDYYYFNSTNCFLKTTDKLAVESLKKMLTKMYTYLLDIKRTFELSDAAINESFSPAYLLSTFTVNESIAANVNIIDPFLILTRKRGYHVIDYNNSYYDIFDYNTINKDNNDDELEPSVFSTKNTTPDLGFSEKFSAISQAIKDNSLNNDFPQFLFNQNELIYKTKKELEENTNAPSTFNKYLTNKCNYSEKMADDFFCGRHYTNKYLSIQRDITLRLFLFCSIPSSLLDKYFSRFGMYFGTNTNAFVSKLNNSTSQSDPIQFILTESYIRKIIEIGISYDVILYLLPKLPQKIRSKKK